MPRVEATLGSEAKPLRGKKPKYKILTLKHPTISFRKFPNLLHH
jgi:hypothetical protein